MIERNKVPVARAIELEEWLIQNCSMGISKDELLSLINQNFNKNESEYLLNAYNMPLSDMKNYLATYDNSHPHIDELTFLTFLESKYNCQRAIVIKRIRSIRAIDKYLIENPNIVFGNIKVYNKLVRDNIPSIIEENGEKAVYHVLSDEEYWSYLLKKDSEELEKVRKASSKAEIKEELANKLEIIRAAAHYHGFTLNDIIEEADLKKENKGGFSKRLILERTYKFKNNLEEKTISLEELIDHINSDDDEDFDLELHPSEQELKLSNKNV